MDRFVSMGEPGDMSMDLLKGLLISFVGCIAVIFVVSAIWLLCVIPSMAGFGAVMIFIISILTGVIGLYLLWMLGAYL